MESSKQVNVKLTPGAREQKSDLGFSGDLIKLLDGFRGKISSTKLGPLLNQTKSQNPVESIPAAIALVSLLEKQLEICQNSEGLELSREKRGYLDKIIGEIHGLPLGEFKVEMVLSLIELADAKAPRDLVLDKECGAIVFEAGVRGMAMATVLRESEPEAASIVYYKSHKNLMLVHRDGVDKEALAKVREMFSGKEFPKPTPLN